jgi:hypothetical protein
LRIESGYVGESGGMRDSRIDFTVYLKNLILIREEA